METFSNNKKTWLRRMEKAQKEHRPKLKDWDHDGFGHAHRREAAFHRFVANVSNKGIFNRSHADVNASTETIMRTKKIDRFSCRRYNPSLPFPVILPHVFLILIHISQISIITLYETSQFTSYHVASQYKTLYLIMNKNNCHVS